MTTGTGTKPFVGLALSGGGSRAGAFGLGCLRALNDLGVLAHVRVVSGISGGSLLAALWAYGPPSFDDFDALATDMLRRGLQRQLVAAALSPRHLTRRATLRALTGSADPVNRTNAFVDVLAREFFGDKLVTDTTHSQLASVLTATDLATGKAVRFGSTVSSCSAHGRILEPIPVAEAVASSAAFPILLPALEKHLTFERNNARKTAAVALADGGIFDNLGLSVLEPGRNPRYM